MPEFGILESSQTIHVRSLSKEDKYEAARTETTLAIAKWIKVDVDHKY